MPALPERRSLGRRQRFKQQRDFARVRSQGQRLVHGCLIANWVRLPPKATSRLGVVTSKSLGNAVVRSRARRLLRETFRLHQHDLREAVDLVLVARNSIVGKKRAAVESEFLAVMRRGSLL